MKKDCSIHRGRYLRYLAVGQTAVAGVVLSAGTAGCGPRSVDVDDPATRQMLTLLLPSRIMIEPFTGLKSFEGDDLPDGLRVVLRPVDSFGDPVKIAGSVRVELYHFRPASGESAGRRIQQWDVRLADDSDQRKYWNRVTQMYEFPLELDVGSVPVADRYVIQVTYNTPLGDHMTSDFVLEAPVRPSAGMAGG